MRKLFFSFIAESVHFSELSENLICDITKSLEDRLCATFSRHKCDVKRHLKPRVCDSQYGLHSEVILISQLYLFNQCFAIIKKLLCYMGK